MYTCTCVFMCLCRRFTHFWDCDLWFMALVNATNSSMVVGHGYVGADDCAMFVKLAS